MWGAANNFIMEIESAKANGRPDLLATVSKGAAFFQKMNAERQKVRKLVERTNGAVEKKLDQIVALIRTLFRCQKLSINVNRNLYQGMGRGQNTWHCLAAGLCCHILKGCCGTTERRSRPADNYALGWWASSLTAKN